MDEKSAQHAALPPCAPSIELHNLELSLVRRPLFGAAKAGAATEEVPILHGTTGTIPAGSLFMVLGGSGSGKTSLLNTISMRLPPIGYRTGGSILFDGAPPAPSVVERSAYVLQTDFLLPFLTVRETLMFAARLRLPAGTPAAVKRARVEALILELGLRDCAETRVGSAHVRGISGGEKRRVSTAVQMVTEPLLLFADEPTTGLDAFTARNLVQTFAAIAASGRTVVCTLHQPRADVFTLFAGALLLSKGRTVFFGPTGDMGYFSALGYACPEHNNPADYFLDISSVDNRSAGAEADSRARLAQLVEHWEARVAAKRREGGGDAGAAAAAATEQVVAKMWRLPPVASWGEQYAVLLRRGLLSQARDVRTLAGLFTESVVIAVLVGAIFYHLAGSQAEITSRYALLYLVGSLQGYQFMVFSIYCLCAELAIFDHETANGLYSAGAFVAARLSVLLPVLLVFPTLFSIIVYYMAALRPGPAHVVVFIATMIGAHAVTFALALFSVAVQRDFSQASLIGNSIYTFLGLASGFLVQLRSIPVWLHWIQNVSFINFTFRVLVNNEFSARTWPCPPALGGVPQLCAAFDGDAIIERLAVTGGPVLPGISILVNVAVLVIAALLGRLGGPAGAGRLPAAQPRALRPGATAGVDVHGGGGGPEAAAPQGVDAAAADAMVCTTPVTVELRALRLVLPAARGACGLGAGRPDKVILNDISCSFAPGVLAGVMGASGCGKSSLLNAVGARVRAGVLGGAVAFNGDTLPPQAVRNICGYVQQHDALLPLLTVRETLAFAAELRLPAGMGEVARAARVDVVVAELGLKDCQGTAIGADAEAVAEGGGAASGGRGVSGGEKRRVSIAVQMLTDPAVLLLDEPTSGLDSFTALNIGGTLRRLAHEERRTVVATVHQPRAMLFELFDDFLLMSAGRLVYWGAGGGAALRYFEGLGHACPALTNPADAFIDLASVDTRDEAAEAESQARVRALVEAYAAAPPPPPPRPQPPRGDGAGPVTEVAAPPEGKKGEAAVVVVVPPAGGRAAGGQLAIERQMGPLRRTLPLLTRRAVLNLKRQPNVVTARVMQTVSFGIILCIFYARFGNDDAYSVQCRIGLLYEFTALIFVGMLNNIAVFPVERNVFYREAADGAYSALSFLLSYTALELPCELAASALFTVFTMAITGLRTTAATFFQCVFVVFCYVNAGESVGIIFCAVIYHIGFSVTLMSVFLSVWSVMSGFFSLGMPRWLQIVNYSSLLKFGSEVVTVNEFDGLTFTCAAAERLPDGSCPVPNGAAVLSLYNFSPSRAPRDLWVMAILAVIYRVAAYGALEALKGRHM